MFVFKFYFCIYLVYVHPFRGQKTTCKIWFSSFTMWVLGLELRSENKNLSHLAGPQLHSYKQQVLTCFFCCYCCFSVKFLWQKVLHVKYRLGPPKLFQTLLNPKRPRTSSLPLPILLLQDLAQKHPQSTQKMEWVDFTLIPSWVLPQITSEGCSCSTIKVIQACRSIFY